MAASGHSQIRIPSAQLPVTKCEPPLQPHATNEHCASHHKVCTEYIRYLEVSLEGTRGFSGEKQTAGPCSGRAREIFLPPVSLCRYCVRLTKQAQGLEIIT